MAYVWQRWLAKEFRAAGLKVVEVDGWQNRGRPASTGSFDPDVGVLTHHTGTTTGTGSRNIPTLNLLISGRGDLPGPLCQWATAYDGTVYVIAAGRANHAGRVGKRVTGAFIGADGNAFFLGNEVDTNGTQKLPEAQRRSIAITNRVYLDYFHRDKKRALRHADVSATGKWDIGQLTTAQLRADIDRYSGTDQQEDDVSAEDVWNKDIVKWAPDETQNQGKKIDAAAQLNQARGYAEDGYDRIKKVESQVNQLSKKLDQVLKKLG